MSASIFNPQSSLISAPSPQPIPTSKRPLCFDKFDKIFNRNTLKIGYSCTQNIGNIIKAHNKKILQKEKEKNTETTNKKCNCRNKKQCPLQEQCLIQCCVYKINIESKNENNEIDKTSYIGSTEGTFKQRLYQHKSDLNIRENKNKTTFASHVWGNRDKGVEDKMSYEILEKCKTYKSGNKYCQVCISECYQILKATRSGQNILNKRKEYFPSCKHKSRCKLISIKTKTTTKQQSHLGKTQPKDATSTREITYNDQPRPSF